MLLPSWLMVINNTQPAESVTIRTIKPAQPPGMASVFVGFEFMAFLSCPCPREVSARSPETTIEKWSSGAGTKVPSSNPLKEWLLTPDATGFPLVEPALDH
jgi:hypothetical protein